MTGQTHEVASGADVTGAEEGVPATADAASVLVMRPVCAHTWQPRSHEHLT
jgi:hypothetical protein